MKNRLLLQSLLMILILVACEKEKKTTETPTSGNTPNYTLEGLWVLEDYPNTAYIFQNGLRYTVYCTSTTNCSWDTVTIASALPVTDPYTFSNDTLRIDLGFGNSSESYIDFDCGGQVLKYYYSPSQYVRWSRSTFDVSTCFE